MKAKFIHQILNEGLRDKLNGPSKESIKAELLSLSKDKQNDAVIKCINSDNLSSLIILVDVCNADLNIIDTFGNTLLNLAVRRGKKGIDILKYLINYYKNNKTIKELINEPNNAGDLPIIHALLIENIEMIKLLLDNGADPNTRIDDIRCLLTYSMINCNPSTVKILIDYGADVNLLNSNNQTPLIVIIKYDYAFKTEPSILDQVQLLIDNGADKNIKDKFGKTALDYAYSKGYYNIIELLK